MKIARNKENIKLTLTKAEWLSLGKVAGWGEDIDPDLVPQDGLGNPLGKPDAPRHDTPGQPPTGQDPALGDTFLDADPNAPEVNTNPTGADDVGLPDGSGDGGLSPDGGQWLPRPEQPGDYDMSSDGAEGMEQQVYYDGKGQIYLNNDPTPHPLDEVLQSQPGMKFKLHPVHEPDPDIPDGSGSLGNAGGPPPPDTSDAPF